MDSIIEDIGSSKEHYEAEREVVSKENSAQNDTDPVSFWASVWRPSESIINKTDVELTPISKKFCRLSASIKLARIGMLSTLA